MSFTIINLMFYFLNNCDICVFLHCSLVPVGVEIIMKLLRAASPDGANLPDETLRRVEFALFVMVIFSFAITASKYHYDGWWHSESISNTLIYVFILLNSSLIHRMSYYFKSKMKGISGSGLLKVQVELAAPPSTSIKWS